MIDSITLTRQGYIKHLATLQRLLRLVEGLHFNISLSFPEAECEIERNNKIAKAFEKLQELIWETGAVSERIHREKGRDDPAYDAHDRDLMNRQTEGMRERFHKAAKELERLARGLWDEAAPKAATPEATYPGAIQEPDRKEDPNQLRLGLKPADARAVATAERSETAEGRAAQDRRSGAGAAQDRRVIDYKKAAAHDDTTVLDGEDEVSGDWDNGL